MTAFTKSIIEDAVLAWLEGLRYQVQFGPGIAPGEVVAMLDEAYRKLTHSPFSIESDLCYDNDGLE